MITKRWILHIFVASSLLLAFGESQFYRSKLMERRKRVLERRLNMQNKLKPQICYDLVGCFADPPQKLTLKRPPEHPDVIKTKFLLYTRNDENQTLVPEYLVYGDDLESVSQSNFDKNKRVKVIIHGFKGSGNDAGVVLAVKSLLEIEDANVVILDWERGAATNYAVAAANTELVGRQLSLVLMDLINLGADPKNIHVIGFSLGAHVAGCASESLKKKQLLVERITGLDPASPLFKRHILRERSRKLDISDARYVDIIHTDGSEIFTDGFGLLKPMGHVDFFPNGGKEQPGCADVKNSVVVSHFNEGNLNRDLACSHLRSWQYFMESIQSQRRQCKFQAWPCQRANGNFYAGTCFPGEYETTTYQEMGYRTNFAKQGVFYLATRAESPYCGEALRSSIITSPDVRNVSGTLNLEIQVKDTSATLTIRCEVRKDATGPFQFYGIGAIDFGTFSYNSTIRSIIGSMVYQSAIIEENDNSVSAPVETDLKVDKVVLEDRKGNRWEYRQLGTIIGNSQTVRFELNNVYSYMHHRDA